MIRSFRHKGLAELFDRGNSAAVRSDLRKRCLRSLDALHRAATPGDLNLPGLRLHRLHGKPVRWAVAVNGPWRITFEWIDGDAWRVDLEQYHRGSAMGRKAEIRVTGEPNRQPTHPGALLREDVLPALELSVSEAARRLRVTRQTLHRILAGEQAVSPDMAVRLGKFCGNGPRLWLAMQAAYDLWHAERRLAGELAKIPAPGRRAA